MSEVQLIPDDDDDDAISAHQRAEHAQEMLRQFRQDWSEDDTAIRDLCRPIIGDRAVNGDDNGVPALVDVVHKTIEKLTASQPLLLLERLDELRPQMDGPGWLARDAERDIITFFLRDAENIQPATEGKP